MIGHMDTFVLTEYGVEANSSDLQTAKIQKVLDMCKENGGKVVFKTGSYRFSGLKIWSNTTIYLEKNTKLIGSENCDDYPLFELPKNMKLYTDKQAFTPGPEEYRRAMFTAYAETNIKIIGEENTVIDGMNCFDENGEEHYRGPHGIFFSNCSNILFERYTITNCGNFMHQLDKCENVVMKNITALAGHDGVHLHCCENFVIESCKMLTGDDCIAGVNIRNLKVRNCELNSSCNIFRIGGCNIDISETAIYGPGYYPHRLTIVKGRNECLPREAGRHNTLSVIDYFSTDKLGESLIGENIVMRNCKIKNVDTLLLFDKSARWSSGAPLRDITFENVTVEGLKKPSRIRADKGYGLTVHMKNVVASFDEDSGSPALFDAENANVIYE